MSAISQSRMCKQTCNRPDWGLFVRLLGDVRSIFDHRMTGEFAYMLCVFTKRTFGKWPGLSFLSILDGWYVRWNNDRTSFGGDGAGR
jgi:hypothetical protein